MKDVPRIFPTRPQFLIKDKKLGLRSSWSPENQLLNKQFWIYSQQVKLKGTTGANSPVGNEENQLTCNWVYCNNQSLESTDQKDTLNQNNQLTAAYVTATVCKTKKENELPRSRFSNHQPINPNK